MVSVPELEAQDAVYTVLQLNGWREPAIQNIKLLNEPFQSDDPTMRACHQGALKAEGGIVVYLDPIEEP
jgi:hypothetical protein